MERPRLDSLLETALSYPLVLVCAGAGYGKTRAVYSFLQRNEVNKTWLQISERDNIKSRFWESFGGVVSLNYPQSGVFLSKIGFPDKDEAFAKFSEAVQKMASEPGKHIMVFDDFHLLNNPDILRLFVRIENMLPENITMMLISRTMPEINMVGMILKQRIFTISEDALRFTEDELAEYFKQLKLQVTTHNLRNVFEDTKGWAFGINLIGQALRKNAKYQRCALEAMKGNIFRLIEAEIEGTISQELWQFLLRLSLIDHLAASLIKELAQSESLLKEMESLHAYIRYDMNLDTYMIHHLFLDYLRQNHYVLTDEVKGKTYQSAGTWCDSSGYSMDALSYYGKAGDYAAIAQKIAKFNVQMPPDMAEYALELFENAPEEVKRNNPLFPGMHIKSKISMGKFDEDTVALAQKYADIYETLPDSPAKSRALTAIYLNRVFLSMFMCTYTDEYEFYKYQKKMADNYFKSPFKIIGKYNLVPVCAWASLVGTKREGAQEEYIDAMARLIPIASKLGNGFFVGFDDLARGELCFYRGQFDEAERYLKKSILKTQPYSQYVTLSRALAYLMRIAFIRGNYEVATENLQAMEPLLSDEDYGVRYTIYDIAHSFYLLFLGQTEQIAEWLKGDFSPYAHPAFIENYANRIKVQYHYQTGQYGRLLGFIENEVERSVLFGKIELKLVQSLVLYKQKQRADAMRVFAEAYELSEPNALTVIFTQFSKDMRTLTAAALKDDNCTIPKEWLREINRKASAIAKQQSHTIAKHRAVNNITKEITLTEREKKILKDLSHGLSRSEIAATQNISVNTVKMVINAIYDRLCVSNLPDAIRVAVARKIV
ncbi:MAG: LuxR C-terminal-related transcriptional regulator [Oscillospiraceae bacterium]|nr:LuxR C-terminal-related transcriptional regulator [Oscillospiraceae bacterium]MCL2280011.1 LuxR C-terminal-related transcriptional regulator [Oscillospiraceae bacterium]